MVGNALGGANKNLSSSSKGVGGRSSPTVPRILSPKKSMGNVTNQNQFSSVSNQVSKDVARSLFKEGINKSDINSTLKSTEKDDIEKADDLSGEVMSNNSKDGSQSSASNMINLSIVNGKIRSTTLEDKNIPDKSLSNTSDGQNRTTQIDAELDDKASTLIDLFKPLDGKNIEDIDDESSAALSSCSLKLRRNEMGLLEFNGKDDFNEVSDSDESNSIDLSCQENPPSSPSPKKDNEIKDRSNNFPIEKSMVANIENNPPFSDGKKEPKRMEANTCNVPPPKVKENDEILCCDGCGCYGMSGEFLNSQACSVACQERIFQRIREKEKKERELLVQKQRREARKREREAREAAEEEEKRRLAENEKIVKDTQKTKATAKNETKDEIILDDDTDDMEIKVIRTISTSSYNSIDSASSKSEISIHRSEPMKTRLKLADGNVDKASVITEGVNNQTNPTRSSGSNRIRSLETLRNKEEAKVPQKNNLPQSSINLPWQDPNTKTGFSWTKYLETTRSKIAPSKIFDELSRFPHSTNRFKVGMKLEAIDPEHPALFCVVTVVSIKGYRIRLHFDGYSDSYDFWEYANSRNIFPPGWCKQHQQRLEPPKDWNPVSHNRESDLLLSFPWPKYMADEASCKIMVKGRRQVLAPKQIFTEPNKLPQNWLAGWNVGMKLEAVDKHNASLVCVATVGNILQSDGRILVHFDGWEIEYDYWVKPDSPYIKPKGWCEQNNVTLNKPKGYRGDFKWEKYLEETRCSAVPAWAFRSQKSSTNSLFRKGMKLEAVDKRNPILIRVATVTDVVYRQLRIHYDGWPEEYDIWLEDSSTEIHPATWCAKTGHPLTLPLTPQEVADSAAFRNSVPHCPTPGCHGIGNIKGPRYPSHNTLEACPYSPRNMGSESLLPDRIQGSFKRQESIDRGNSYHLKNLKHYNPKIKEKTVINHETEEKQGRETRRKRKRNVVNDEGGDCREVEENRNDKSTKYQKISYNQNSSHIDRGENARNHNGSHDRHFLSNELLRDNVFRPPHDYTSLEMGENGVYTGYHRVPSYDMEKNVDFLRNRTSNLSPNFVAKWSVKRVAYFVSTLPGICYKHNAGYRNGILKLEDYDVNGEPEIELNGLDEMDLGDIPNRFLDEEIDGEAFLMLTQTDLVKTLGLKLGPALKISNTLVLIRSNCRD